jgi:urease accessory protein UreE
MTIVENLSSDPGDLRRDTITLGWEERRQGHGRRQSDGGVEFAISLPNGTVLKGGDCLLLRAEGMAVVVREANEPVYVIKPNTKQEWAFYAYQIGNRHQSVMIAEHELVCLQNPAVKSLFDQLHIHYEPDVRPFTAALSNVKHSH